ncbi:lactate utilization protein [Anaerorhabdus sp.]|uniref:lactate utilization protein n=1 Tax=Anaerorhabdus sp. TaxID=1872524 RepID=UPI002FCB6314
MDDHGKVTLENQITMCKAKLELHQFKVSVVENKEECIELLKECISPAETVAVGGSMTLFEAGIIDYLEHKTDIHYLDRYHTEDAVEIYHQSLLSDVYITSSNAVTLDGKLYNVDGTGNRVAALTYGPDRVLVVVGWNKLVKDIDSAIERVEQIAAPTNAVRLNRGTPCTTLGYCVHCESEKRICSTQVITTRSHIKERIHVIIVKENLGY